MADLLQQVHVILEKEQIGDVQLLLCGDSLDGMLRPSQLLKLRWGVVESCMRFSEYMAQWINALSEDATVSVCGVDGNHTETRTLNSKRGEFPGENLEKVIFWFLSERLRTNPNVIVDAVTEQRKHVSVQGFNLLLTHHRARQRNAEPAIRLGGSGKQQFRTRQMERIRLRKIAGEDHDQWRGRRIWFDDQIVFHYDRSRRGQRRRFKSDNGNAVQGRNNHCNCQSH